MNLSDYKVVFWDFDGVIKESLEVKTQSFVDLFSDFGSEITERIRRHHLEKSGISRFIKIPLYLSWAGSKSDKKVKEYLKKFKDMTLEGVINSPWVPGVMNYLESNYIDQDFILITGTPKEDIDYILHKTKIKKYFRKYYGAPDEKSLIISNLIEETSLSKNDYIMIGDALVDFEAAEKNKIDFLLREHEFNLNFFKGFKIKKIKNFLNLNE